MEDWKKFELDCTEYLNNTYGSNFIHHGFSDSTVSDIEFNNGIKSFFIEAKMNFAQSGQFVLLPNYDEKKFIFSSNNKSDIDENVEFIMDYMNKNFDKFAKAGTRGVNINLPQKLFSNWIIKSYRKRGVEFLITKGNDYIVFPIQRYLDYFNISGKYRIKQSGTNKLAKKDHDKAKARIKQLYYDAEFITDANNELFAKIDNQIISNIISLDEFDLYLSKEKDSLYKVKKRSNTRNLNVIFSIKLIKEQDQQDLKSFINRIL
ncbi:MAG: hypothetical protein SPI59_05570 [Finegoldia sp.]|nr:hypothetical protein [Finegoldia sp.]